MEQNNTKSMNPEHTKKVTGYSAILCTVSAEGKCMLFLSSGFRNKSIFVNRGKIKDMKKRRRKNMFITFHTGLPTMDETVKTTKNIKYDDLKFDICFLPSI